MPIKLRLIWIGILAAIFSLGFFGLKVDTWDTAYPAWLEVDAWLINHAAHPGLVILAIILLTGSIIGPDVWHFIRRHLIAMELKGLPAMSLPQMNVTELAIYLRDHSAWGWRRYGVLMISRAPSVSVAQEIQRAAYANLITIVGNTGGVGAMARPGTEEIPFGYWQQGQIDTSHLFEPRYRTNCYVQFRGPTYEHLTLPTNQVEAVWPRSRAAMRIWIILWVRAKLTWFWIRGRVEMLRSLVNKGRLRQ
jgi:hypothetical protein